MKNFVIFVKQKIKNRYVKNKKYCKVRDHCHFTGKNRSAAHSICNLKYSVLKKLLYLFIMDQTMIISVS